MLWSAIFLAVPLPVGAVSVRLSGDGALEGAKASMDTVLVEAVPSGADSAIEAAVFSANHYLRARAVDGGSGFAKGTVALWLKPLDWISADDHWRMLVNWRAVLNRQSGANGSFTVRGDPSGGAVLMIGNFEEDLFDTLNLGPVHVRSDGWTHVVFAWDEEELTGYVNGEEVARKPRKKGVEQLVWAPDFILGGGHWSGIDQGRTAVADLMVSSGMITADEVSTLHAQRRSSLAP